MRSLLLSASHAVHLVLTTAGFAQRARSASCALDTPSLKTSTWPVPTRCGIRASARRAPRSWASGTHDEPGLGPDSLVSICGSSSAGVVGLQPVLHQLTDAADVPWKRTRRKLYFALMGTCPTLFVLSGRRSASASVPAAVAMSVVAMVILGRE
ncbi:hypothetical protein ACU686_18810 [Yinghuangia aomiensis]